MYPLYIDYFWKHFLLLYMHILTRGPCYKKKRQGNYDITESVHIFSKVVCAQSATL